MFGGGMMSGNLVEVVFGARDDTGRAMTTAQQNLQKFGQQATRMGRQMMMAGTVVTGALFAATKSTTNYGESHLKVHKQTGLTVEQSQRLAYAAEQEHASFDDLTKALPILTKYMGYARDGQATYLREFEKMGITVHDAEGNLRDVHDVLMEMSDYMSDKTIPTQEKTATAMALLGRRGAEMLPFLGLGRDMLEGLGDELERTRGIMSQAESEEMKEFNDALLKLQTTFAGVKDDIARAVLPIFERLVEVGQRVAEWLKGMDPELRNTLTQFVLIGAVLTTVLGSGLLVAGMMAGMANNVITLVKALGLMNASGAVSIAVFGKLLLITIGLVAAMEALMALKGIIEARRTRREAVGVGQDVDEVRRLMDAGEITREEAQRRFMGVQQRGAGLTERTGRQEWGMTAMERAMHEVGRFRNIQVDAHFTKDEELPDVMGNIGKNLIAEGY